MFMLISGGAASGKSEYAEAAALKAGGKRVYIATMKPYGRDALTKIERHRALRSGKGFETLECFEDLSGLAVPAGCTALLECLSNLTANECFGPLGFDGAASRVLDGVNRLAEVCSELIVVTNELFSDGGAYTAETAQYLEVLSALNRELAAKADVVAEVVCGRAVIWKGQPV